MVLHLKYEYSINQALIGTHAVFGNILTLQKQNKPEIGAMQTMSNQSLTK